MIKLPDDDVARKVRHPWMDLAKGACIFFVAFGHTVGWYGRNFTGDEPIILDYVSATFRQLSMPLFFLISGMLAASKMERPLRASWHNTAGLYLLYCIWTAIFCLKLAVPGGRDGLPYPDTGQILLAFLLPVQFWYIWTLPVYYLIAWTLQRVLGERSIYALVPMALLSLGSWWIGQATADFVRPPFDLLHTEAFAFNLIWFYLGCKGKALWIRRVESGNIRRAGVVFTLFLALSITATHFDMREPLAVFLAPFALAAALEFLGSINHAHPLALRLRVVGTQTLPVYVMHVMVLTALTFVVGKLALAELLPYENFALQLLLPILVSVGIVAVCLRVGSILNSLPVLRYLVQSVQSPFDRTRFAAELPLGVQGGRPPNSLGPSA